MRKSKNKIRKDASTSNKRVGNPSQGGDVLRASRFKSTGLAVFLGVVTSLAAAGIWYFSVTKYENLRVSTVGSIATQLYSKDESPVIFLGHTAFVLAPDDLQGDPFRVWSEHGRLMIDATFRDQSGAIVATMRGDQWSVNSNRILDRNFSNASIEVLDERGDVAFHVAMCRYGAVLEAKFHTTKGRSFAIASGHPTLHDDRPKVWTEPGPPDGALYTFPGKWSDNGTFIRKMGAERESTAYFEYGLRGEDLVTVLRPWFRYPSSRFLGEMVVPESEICTANAPGSYSLQP